MTPEQKDTLRDCFEGCMSYEYAVAAAGLQTQQAVRDAFYTWRRWTMQMDEVGHYTF